MNTFYFIIFIIYVLFDFFTVSNYKKQIKKITDENRELRKKITNEVEVN